MRDGQTVKTTRRGSHDAAFLDKNRAVLVTLSGATAGNEYSLDRAPMTLGRGPEVDLSFDDAAMSKEHAAFELGADGFRVRDLGSTNGILVNGGASQAADLKHGDRLTIGQHVFQYLVETTGEGQRVWVIDDS